MGVVGRGVPPAPHLDVVSPSRATDELDALTLARAKRGDARAWLDLVRGYERRVYAVVSRMLGPDRPELVRDLAQETFLRVFRALPDFELDGPARLSTWILTIATRLAIDELRRPAPGAADDPDRVHAPDRTEAEAERRELGAAIARALAGLTPTQRAVIVLREYHGLEAEQIARALDLEPGAVRARLFRARRALRKALHRGGWHV